jgi:16S rRNA (cytosine1402-N4)-methyltransferase
LLREVVSLLAPRPGDTILDCTAGLGGHAAALAEVAGADRSGGGPHATVVLTDLDPGNLARAEARLRALPNPPAVHAIHASFVEAPRKVNELGLHASVLLADLGFSSNQMMDPARGFSFSADGPLDMRLNPQSPITGAELVNSLTERELSGLLADYGEEPHARSIARNLVRRRAERPILTTAQFASIVRDAVPARDRFGGGIDPATRSFQALRIAVNDELGNLAALLTSIQQAARRIAAGEPAFLAKGARVGIISFHSLEDRQVKQSFAALVEKNLATHITRKPAQAADDEIAANPRSRSAKFRVIRIGPEVPGSD